MSEPGSFPVLTHRLRWKRRAVLAELATWTSDWRNRWGRRANALLDAGVPWPEDEIRAFDEIKPIRERGDNPDADLKPPKPVARTIEKAGTFNLE